MRKIIAEWKWDKLFDKCEEGLGEKDSEGNLTFTPEEIDERFKRIDELEKQNYIIVGPRTFYNSIKDKIYNYKLRHLSLGKIHYKGKSLDDEFEIIDIPWNLHWQTDKYLLVIIRDYLRYFINNTKVIGNCVYTKEELDPKRKEYYKAQKDNRWEEWKTIVNNVANEFDDLYKMENHKFEPSDETERKKLIIKAFKDLAYIFDDLNWQVSLFEHI